jgi:2-methylcitrate dehydratase PrpD
MDDGNRFGSVHPAIVVLPAALALAEKQKIMGQNFIASIIAGYETLLYIAKNINPEHLQRGFHTTANVGAFGAAAACSKILELNKAQVENALSIAGLCGGGLLEVLTSGQMMKPFQTARAAQAGLMAAMMAKQGARGPELVFEGEKGFFRAYADKDVKREDFEGLGTAFEIMNSYFKIYSACRHIHPALDAVEEIVKRNQLTPETIKSVEVETYSVAFRLTGHRSANGSEIAAKFSMPISIALLLAFGSLDKSVCTEHNVLSPLVQELADKVVICIDPDRDALYPNQRGARVTIKAGNNSYIHAVAVPRGEPEHPLDDIALVEKFNKNAGMVFPSKKVQKICEEVFSLENISLPKLLETLAKFS